MGIVKPPVYSEYCKPNRVEEVIDEKEVGGEEDLRYILLLNVKMTKAKGYY